MKPTILQRGEPGSDLILYAHMDGSALKALVPTVTDDAVVTLLEGSGTSAYKGLVSSAGGWRGLVSALEAKLEHGVNRTLLITWSAGSQVAVEACVAEDPPDTVIMLDGLYGQKPPGSKPGDGQVVPSAALAGVVNFALRAASGEVSPRGAERKLIIFHSRIATTYASSKECAEYVQAAVEAELGAKMQPATDVTPGLLDGHAFVEALAIGNLRIVEFAGATTGEHVTEAHLWNEAAKLWVPWISAAPPAPLPPGVRLLRLASPRMQGADVLAWQLFLQAEGLEIKADADFGPVTAEKTGFFQRAFVLPETRMVDAATLAAAASTPRAFVPVPYAQVPGPPSSPQADKRVRGLDVSRHQGKMSWPPCYAIGIRFAFCKATEGVSWKDPRFLENVDGIADARDAGIITGAYHYFLPHQDPVEQAVHFFKVAGGKVDLPPVIDFETLGGVPSALAVQRARTFIEETQKLWKQGCILYTYSNFWEMLLKANAFAPEDLVFFAELELWLADYRAKPQTPKTWDAWVFLQFDGDGGLVLPNGVDADFNVFSGDEAALIAWTDARRPTG